MSRLLQRRMKLKKALSSIEPATCFNPDKARYTSLYQARKSAQVQHMRPYRCGAHYHLTSDTKPPA
ncbi:hypothetical protein PBI_GAIA_62 [Mycobacterium phage Gaia]|uniref:Uncharacterized protein n=1 Tax=Mycobacterium phage Gaia TaxID=1486472 RepID=A0A068F4L1_9CAUD|nr:hypothetical protein VC46_gp171 [Mycobacterium phage Gaia]AID58881.1 hypothetical protein PBI_GAIA_62 [Mycobacterium phage Gaia]AYR00110.1 hypothetical protein PBI_NEBKISS_63 [Mycobacterium phage Nebkiss]